jgi:hypothetical protein
MNLLTTESMVVLAQVTATAGAVVAVTRWRVHVEQSDAEKSFQQEWDESGWRSLHRGRFQLCRILAAETNPKAEFIVQDERRTELGRLCGRSGTTLVVARNNDVDGPTGATPPALKTSAPRLSKRPIIIQDQDRVIAEALRKHGLTVTGFLLRWQQQEFQIEKKKWPSRGTSRVRCGEELIGVFRRTGGLSRKTLFALRRNLPDELKVCLCSIAVLEWT